MIRNFIPAPASHAVVSKLLATWACWLGLAALAAASPLPWVTDHFPQALALARQRKLPVFVEVWAPW